jgi:CubicO group peptidase (beta-lactamase class C family)
MIRLRIAAICCTVFWCAAFYCKTGLAQEFHGATDLDAVINQAIREDKIPGAVVLVGHNGQVVYRKAYGYRALLPVKEAMTADTIFDIASLTKIVATTTGMMKLVERGLVRIDDPVQRICRNFRAVQVRSPCAIS